MTTSTERPSVLKPTGHVVLAYRDAGAADDAARALAEAALGAPHRYTDLEMLAAIEAESQAAGPLASVGQEMNLLTFHRTLAEQGHHWLVVPAPDDAATQHIAEVARRSGARLAQKYNRLIIEELI